MTSPIVQHSPEETLRLLEETAKQHGDSFIVKIGRKKGLGGFHEQLATLGGATVNMIANPESWLSKLSGGGDYMMQFVHSKTPSVRVGSAIPVTMQEKPRPFDASVLTRQDYDGPAEPIYVPGIEFPARAQASGSVQVVGGDGVPRSVPFQSSDPALSLQQERAQLAADKARLEAEKKALEERTASERRIAEERLAEAKWAEREAKLKAEVAETLNAVRGKGEASGNTKEMIIGLASVLTPLVIQLMDSSAKRSEAQMNMLMASLKKDGPSEEMKMMLELTSRQSQQQADMMGRVVEAMGAVSRSSVGMMEAMADIQFGGPQESPLLQAAKEGIKAIAALSKGAQPKPQQVQARPVQQQQPALPPHPATQPQQRAPNGVPMQQPAQVVVDKPAPAPNHPPAFDGVQQTQQAQQPAQQPAAPLIDQIEALIRVKHEPVEDVAKLFIEGAKHSEPSIVAAFKDADGDLDGVIEARLSDWLAEDPSNIEYGKRALDAIEQAGIEAGLFVDEAPETVDGQVVEQQ